MPRNCPKGSIKRKSYRRSSYTKKSGVKVRGSYIKSSCIRDRGSRGKGKKIIQSLKKGALSQYGYKVKSPKKSRRSSLRKAVKSYGKSSTIKKLNVIGVYNKRSSPSTVKKIKQDMEYVRTL